MGSRKLRLSQMHISSSGHGRADVHFVSADKKQTTVVLQLLRVLAHEHNGPCHYLQPTS